MHSQCLAAGALLPPADRRSVLVAPRKWGTKTSRRSRSRLSVRLCPLCSQGGTDDSSSDSTSKAVLSIVAKLGVFSLVSGAAIKYSSASILQSVTQVPPAKECLPDELKNSRYKKNYAQKSFPMCLYSRTGIASKHAPGSRPGLSSNSRSRIVSCVGYAQQRLVTSTPLAT